MECPHCQTELPDEARFCFHCGRPLPAQPDDLPVHARGERRPVTILFADLSGFTAMLERMDPEDARGLINRCFDHLVPVVEKYGGVVDKFIGDEVMALFGAPVAHEDDSARALWAALEMMESLAAFNAREGTAMQLHIGVNTGLVVAGEVGSSGRRAYTVMGAAVNLAARLEEASAAGQILVGPAIYRLTAPLFEFEPLGPISLQGRAEPLPVYRLLGPAAQPGALRGLAGLTSPLVGREAELAGLLAASRALSQGQGGVVVITGEPGLGKSRLVREWRAAAPRVPPATRWAEGRCLSHSRRMAYHLLADLLRSLLALPGGADEPETRMALEALCRDLFAGDFLEVYPYLGHLLALYLTGEAYERVHPLDPQALSGLYLSAVRRLLRSWAKVSPLVLVCEDVHWADPSSVELLLRLLPLVRGTPLLFCFVSRPDQDVTGWRLVTAAREQGVVLTEVSLQPLSEADGRQLVANLLRVEALPEQVRRLILERAGGNPFFLEEIIRTLIDREVIVLEGEGWVCRQEVGQVVIPETLQSLLLARIDRLPEEVQRTLRIAAVIGRRFPLRVLETVLRGGA